MTRTTAAWLLAGAVVVMAAFLGGRVLQGDRNKTTVFDLNAAAYEATGSLAGLSKGGFSGFTEAGGDGRTVIAGRVVSVSRDAITLEGSGGERSTLRLSGAGPLRRLEPAAREALRPGVTVIVRRESSSDVAEAVLVVSEP